MPESYNAQNVKCPFYKWDSNKKQKIACEGLEEASTLQLSYRYGLQYKRQIEVFCCRNYKNCEIYRMICEMKYKED